MLSSYSFPIDFSCIKQILDCVVILEYCALNLSSLTRIVYWYHLKEIKWLFGMNSQISNAKHEHVNLRITVNSEIIACFKNGENATGL